MFCALVEKVLIDYIQHSILQFYEIKIKIRFVSCQLSVLFLRCQFIKNIITLLIHWPILYIGTLSNPILENLCASATISRVVHFFGLCKFQSRELGLVIFLD
tara:strand:+ start:2770 stop:3075 length:306 start_codon:yes stop_codon:yes gene_type:complete